MNSGTLAMTWTWPRSSGIHRHSSMLARIFLPSGLPLLARYDWRSFSNCGCCGMQAAHVGADVGSLGGALDDDLGIEELRLTIEIGVEQDRRLDDASATRIARVLEQGQRDLDVGFADRFGIELRGRRNGRQREILGGEAPIVGLEYLRAQRGAVVGQPGFAEPQRRVAARGVEVGKDGALFQLLRRALGRKAGELWSVRRWQRDWNPSAPPSAA